MKTKFHTVAGGVVINTEGRVLVLERRVEREGRIVHEIRLPKGHIDPGETAEEAALREVGEESGYWRAVIISDLGVAHSTFDFKGKHHERDERYFLMRLENAVREAPRPSGKEEALFQPQWLDLKEAEKSMTYASEQEFIRRARHVLSQQT
ncbi:MAG TPA: NUDIX domain-containing protein [Candidatus Hydrogenedentes bacterium]|nr:NUDIX domain-containing protein [Candidatus Hydrogenedentota bacterium]